jgi:hypothetical protein
MDPKTPTSNLQNTHLKDSINDMIDSELLGEDMILSPNDLEKKLIHINSNNLEIGNLGKKIMKMVNYSVKPKLSNFTYSLMNEILEKLKILYNFILFFYIF